MVYHLGKQLVLADTLSRAFVQDDETLEEIFGVNDLSTVSKSDEKLAQLKETTDAATQLSAVIRAGWPSSKQDVTKESLPFWNYHDVLSLSDSIVFKGERVVIPKKMQQEMLKHIHGSHFGIKKCKCRARDVLFWPEMTSQIQEMISHRQIGSTYQRNNMKKPLLTHEVLKRPWSQVGADLFVFSNQHYLILIDYLSN